jgi:hypothetical protein
MLKRRAVRRTGKLVLAGIVAAAFSAAPIEVFKDFSLDQSTALAKGGGGGGNGGGNNGGGNGGGKGASSSDAAGAGKSAAAAGHNKSETAKSASALGSLNASHASATARAHASPNSQVGKLAAYEAALAEGDLEAAAAALGSAANKEITPEVVAEVNQNMSIESTPEEEAEMAELAEATRTAEPSEENEAAEEAPAEEEDVAEGEPGDDPTEEEGGEIASAAEGLIDGSTAQ